ncbi:MAG: HlyD family efflux transporter periplasmic adaptor subunit [Fimbriimonadaceae bacterium]|nr:HlyD family efflux transporter periplasmic adaptor subunit [Fimbriimonadaceae bacterium]QYK57826.1 MAG: HlyD family efflux transporter periplasmic adaptor subunit [Fimbriimonadaceae bacterium]
MNRWLIGGGVALLLGAVYIVVSGSSDAAGDVEYRYAPVIKDELLLSSSSTGVLVPLTRVDVKSKAGGKVVQLRVEEGTRVKQGDVIAVIDPRDVQATFDQASADLSGAQARVDQARLNATMEGQNAQIRVRDAEIALETARIRLAKAEENERMQPMLSSAEIDTARANLEAANQNLKLLRDVTLPQTRREAEGQARRAKADLDAATAEMERQEKLLESGYVAKSSVERQRATLEAARATEAVAQQRFRTIESELQTQLRAQEARVAQAEESLRQAQANSGRVTITKRDLDEARAQVRAAEASLARARSDLRQVGVRKADVQSASAGAVRSRVAMDNALTQLKDTTVVAPRDGIVTVKYLEEGTIIPPGTSTFAQGTSLVQIADTTQMFVECNVDEADIANVRIGQQVRVIVEAYPGRLFKGAVRKVFPAAETNQALTTVRVRVEVVGEEEAPKTARPGRRGSGAAADAPLRPGMNATCEFIQLKKDDVLAVPQQAVKREGDKTFVEVKTSDPKKPVQREVKTGASGNETIEILEGLKEGEEVVVAKIDLAAMRDRQEKMKQVEQGGGFGSMNRGGPSQSRASGGGGGRASGGGR